MVFGTHYLHFEEQDKQFFVFFVLNDAGNYRTGHFYSAAGQDLGTAIDRRDYDDLDPGACPTCLAWREHVAGYFPRTSIVVAGDGTINVFHNLNDFSIQWSYFDRERGRVARPGMPGFGANSGMPYDAHGPGWLGSIELFIATTAQSASAGAATLPLCRRSVAPGGRRLRSGRDAGRQLVHFRGARQGGPQSRGRVCRNDHHHLHASQCGGETICVGSARAVERQPARRGA
jgi:hypothetical protein